MKAEKIITIISLLWFLFCFDLPSGSAKETLIGVVMTGNSPYNNALHESFADALNAKMPAGAKFKIIVQRPFPDPIALSNAARKLIAADVDLIVTYGSPATLAVIHEKSDTPHVYAGAYDPEAARIGGPMVTGSGYKVPVSSLLRHLYSLKQISTLNVVYSSLEEDSVRQLDELLKLTKEQGIAVKRINIRTRRDIEAIDSKAAGDALFITGSAIVNTWIDDLLSAYRDQRQPSACLLPDLTEAGIVITLHQSAVEQGAKAAEMAARILAGEQPRGIKPELLRNTELVFNLREAKELGLKNPINLIVDATRVIK